MTDSSAVEEQTVDPAATENSDVNAAESSTADDVETSMLDAVESALASPEASSTSSEQDPDVSEGDGEPDAEANADAEGEPETGEDPEFTDKANKRIRQLAAEKNELRAEIEPLKEKAGRFDAITSFMETNGLEPQDVDNGFEIMALLKNGDMRTAYQRLAPIMDYVSQAVGATLPKDLQEQVQLGYITPENAQQLAQSRYSAQANAERAQRVTEQAQRQAQEQQREQLAKAAITAVDNWYDTKAAKDPDWKLKENRVVDLVKLHCLEKGLPNSAEAAVEIAENALKQVEADIRRFRPKPEQITPTAGRTSNPAAKPEPESMLDVVMQNTG